MGFLGGLRGLENEIRVRYLAVKQKGDADGGVDFTGALGY